MNTLQTRPLHGGIEHFGPATDRRVRIEVGATILK
jgi:hypothetical protein